MNITPIDNRLFAVTDAVPDELIQPLLTVDWSTIPWTRQEAQEHWPRRRLDHTSTPLAAINEYIANNVHTISNSLGIEFASADTYWWLDDVDFTVGIHTDGHLPSAMQLFWVMPAENFGTTFYNSRIPTDVKYAFPGVTNSGYLVLNKPNPDGSQPLQWHGMLNPVPAGMIRVTSYTIFGDY